LKKTSSQKPAPKPKKKNGCANCARLTKKGKILYCKWPVPFWMMLRMSVYDHDKGEFYYGAVGKDSGENCATWKKKKVDK